MPEMQTTEQTEFPPEPADEVAGTCNSSIIAACGEIPNAMSPDQKIDLFLNVFHGNRSTFAIRRSTTVDGKTKISYETVHRPVSRADIARHIDGKQPLLTYLIREDGERCNFFAFDFDCKPDKPDQAQYFCDVVKVSEVLTKLSIPHILARSTGTDLLFGFHIYAFFEGPYSAARLLAIAGEIWERSGHMEELRRGTRRLPEFFPKQPRTGDGPGNGIRPPMSENGIAKGRNCIIDSVGNPVPDQWTALREAAERRVPLDILDKIIAENHLKVDKPTNSLSKVPEGSCRAPGPTQRGSATAKLPLIKLKPVLDKRHGCRALAAVAIKSRTEVLGFHEGSAFLSIVSQFSGWRDWLKNKLKIVGWDDTWQHEREVDKFLNYGYAPFSCQKLQDLKICTFHDPQTCLLKKFSNGTLVVPSPIRFAYGAKSRLSLQPSEGDEP